MIANANISYTLKWFNLKFDRRYTLDRLASDCDLSRETLSRMTSASAYCNVMSVVEHIAAFYACDIRLLCGDLDMLLIVNAVRLAIFADSNASLYLEALCDVSDEMPYISLFKMLRNDSAVDVS